VGVSVLGVQSDRHVHKVVCVRAGPLAPVEEPGAYVGVRRRVLGNDGQIRPLTSPGPRR
jgi:hypothetical protein